MGIHITRDDIIIDNFGNDPKTRNIKPMYVGQIYLDAKNNLCYMAFGKESSSWTLLQPELTNDLTADLIKYSISSDNSIMTVKDALDKLLYVDLEIKSFKCDTGNLFEIGSEFDKLVFSWSYDREIISQSLADNIGTISIERSERSYIYEEPIKINTATTLKFTLKAFDGTKEVSRTIGIDFLNYGYWGVSKKPGTFTSDFVKSLKTHQLVATKTRNITFTANADEYFYYAIPSRLSAGIKFSNNGFIGGVDEIARLKIPNSTGYEEEYCLYQSDNPNLGLTTINIS